MAWWTRPTIRAVLLVPMLALLLVSAGSLLAMQWVAARAAVDEIAGRLVRTGLMLLEDELKDRLDPAQSLVTYLAGEFGRGAYAIDGDEALQPFALGTLAAAPQVGVVVIMNTEYAGLGVLRTNERQPVVARRMDFSANPAADIAMQTVRDRDTPYWGPLLDIQLTGATYMNTVMPLRRDGALLGLAAAFVSVDELSRLAEQVSQQQNSTVFVLHGTRSVIAHPLLLGTHLPPGQAGRAWPIETFPDPLLRAFLAARSSGAAAWPGGKAPEGLTTFAHGNEEWFAIARDIPGYGDEPLIIGAYRKTAELDRPFRVLYISGLAGLGVLGLAALATVLLGRAISSPLRRTAGAAEAIGKLEVSEIVPMPGSAIREMDDLARAFNRMLDGLRAFGRYVPRALVSKLIEEGRVGAGTEERVLTVMFTDIRGFSSICEGMPPKEVAAFINHHLSELARCIEEEGGTIDKFIGDAVMAFWGAPERLDDTATPACRAALRIAAAIEADNARRCAEGRMPVGIRVGIHTGPLIVGDIGAPSRINYTVVGDVVNTAQRLESLGKEVAPEAEAVILISRETRERLPADIPAVPAGVFHVKGREGTVEVFRLG